MAKYVVPMFESESGWGSKIDGYAGPFETKEQAEAFRKAYNNKWNNEKEVPDWYIMALEPVIYNGQICNYRSEV